MKQKSEVSHNSRNLFMIIGCDGVCLRG